MENNNEKGKDCDEWETVKILRCFAAHNFTKDEFLNTISFNASKHTDRFAAKGFLNEIVFSGSLLW